MRRGAFDVAPVFSHPAFDAECRIVVATMGDDVFGSIYVPNGGKDYDAKIAFFEALVAWARETCASGKRLVLCGDMNVARAEVDVHPSQRVPNAIGQRPEERALFAKLLDAGLVDVGRALHPDDARMFTWWPYWRQARERNVGWRLDYVLASRSLAERATEHGVRRMVGTSDHAPVVVVFR